MNTTAVPHPGDVIQKILFDRGVLTLAAQAEQAGIGVDELASIYDQGEITPSQAFRLSTNFGTSAVVWLEFAMKYAEANPIIPFPTQIGGDLKAPVADRAQELAELVWHELIRGLKEGSYDDKTALLDSVVALGEGMRPSEQGLAVLVWTALRSGNPEISSAATQALTRFDDDSATVIAYANTLKGSTQFRAGALRDLFGVSPSIALERAYNLICENEHDLLLRQAARDVLRLAKNIFPEFRLRSDEGQSAWERRVCKMIATEIASGEAEFLIKRREPVSDCELALLVNKFVDSAMSEESSETVSKILSALPSLGSALLIAQAKENTHKEIFAW